MMLYAILFLSGASVLALELLASRIMTPYFGVSLYIWTGILSITLIALAPLALQIAHLLLSNLLWIAAVWSWWSATSS